MSSSRHVDTEEILATARDIWGPGKNTLEEIAIALQVVCGDISRQARDHQERGTFSVVEIQKELGNLLLSTVRWIDDTGLNPSGCILHASSAQRIYRENRENRHD